MELINGKIHLTHVEHEALYLIFESYFPKDEPPEYPLAYFRRTLEELRDDGKMKYDDLMANRWNLAEQKAAAKANIFTHEVAEWLTYELGYKLAEKLLARLELVTRQVH